MKERCFNPGALVRYSETANLTPGLLVPKKLAAVEKRTLFSCYIYLRSHESVTQFFFLFVLNLFFAVDYSKVTFYQRIVLLKIGSLGLFASRPQYNGRPNFPLSKFLAGSS